MLPTCWQQTAALLLLWAQLLVRLQAQQLWLPELLPALAAWMGCWQQCWASASLLLLPQLPSLPAAAAAAVRRHLCC